MPWKTLLLLVALLPGGRALCAQAVRGELVDAAGSRPVAGALVVLLDASGLQVEGGLTDRDGRVLLRAPAPGRYTLRAERVGQGSVSSPALDLAAGRTVDHRLVMPAQMVQLEGIVVQGERRRCTLVAEAGRQTAALWEEARKALNAAAWTERRRPFRVQIVRHSRTLEPTTLRVEAERTSRRSGLSTSPFESQPVERLVEEGFVRTVGDSVDYHGPDAHVLLSDAFLETHCFRVQDASDQTRGLTGLAFEPVRGRSRPDVRGVLWLDPKTAELRHLEYSYTGLDLRGPTDAVGGRIEFERLPSGEWIIPRWRIRVPLVEVERIQDGLNWVQRRRVTRLQEEAGEVVELRTLTGQLVRSRERATLAGTVFDSTRAAPLAGARMRLAGTSATAETDAQGHFRLADVAEGRYDLHLSHPRMDSLQYTPPPLLVEVRREAGAPVQLAIPPLAQVLASRCPVAERTPGTGVVAGVVSREGEGAPAPGTPVVLSWPAAAGIPAGSTIALTDAHGHYLACAVPVGVAVRAGPLAAVASAPSELRANPDRATRFDLTFPAAPPPSAGRLAEAEVAESAAPAGRIRLTGRLLDAESRRPVAGATVRIQGVDTARTTSARGEFAFESVAPGTYRVEIAHAEYGTRVQPLEVRGEGRAEVSLAVARRETVLAPLVVTAMSAEERTRRASAVARAVFNRDEIEQLDRGATQLVGDVLRRLPGVHVRELYHDQSQMRSTICIENRREVMGPTRAIPCAMVVMDDIPLRFGLGLRELVTLRLREIESIEYLAPLSARARYGKDAEGGAVVIYTLGKGPHAKDRPTASAQR